MFELSDSARDKVNKCGEDFSCLSGRQGPVCAPEFILSDEILFVKKARERSCDYFVAFGNSGICRCPARIELFKQYKV